MLSLFLCAPMHLLRSAGDLLSLRFPAVNFALGCVAAVCRANGGGHVCRQVALNGEPFGKFMIHDGMRAIDYLLSRPEVDPRRIGYCGQSGGGTQTASMMVVDPRIAVAAPSSYETTWRRLFESMGPQDSEQVFAGAVAAGFDMPDTLLLRAPRPTLVMATSDDFFPIQGTLEGFAQAKQAFAALGVPDNVALVVDDFNHGYTPLTRTAMYAFFMQHFGVAGNSSELNVTLLSDEQLQISPTGQVATSYNSKRVQDFNYELYTVSNVAALQQQRSTAPDKFLAGVPAVARGISGYREPLARPQALYKGRVNRATYNIEKWIVLSEGHDKRDETQLMVPLLVFVPLSDASQRALLFVDPLGKSTNGQVGGFFEQLVMAGFVVAAADVSGVGEAGPGWTGGEQGYGETYVEFLATYLNRSVVGIHAHDIVSVSRFLRMRPDVSSVTLVANETLSEAALHAAVFDADMAGVALVHPLVSYEQTASVEFYYSPPWSQVFGVLAHYDLCDLAATLAPTPLLLVAPRDATGAEASAQLLSYSFNSTSAAYTAKGAASKFLIAPDAEQTAEQVLFAWLKSSS
eukprot:TRINITY_DN3393_c0_g1_i2.p1 TRINITY_DN3393_c0_g1~~TRINITY_DN3393_c0_g1_i2.p1  ORF type:complete len:575 (-),score=201.98 TRINITY_DN3393_c0_g1_i2:118-1842(-)